MGSDGINLQKQWSENPEAYLSVAAENMPNYFQFMGPGAPVGHGSIISSCERISLWICDMVGKMQTQNYSSVKLKTGKAKAWQNQMLAWLDKTVWKEPCNSSFKNGTSNGSLYSFHGGSRLHYFELLNLKRYEDFEWTNINPEPELEFAWLANGFMAQELDNHGEDNA